MLSDQLLAQLPPFTNKEKILIQDQNVDDIIDAIVKAQKNIKKTIITYIHTLLDQMKLKRPGMCGIF